MNWTGFVSAFSVPGHQEVTAEHVCGWFVGVHRNSCVGWVQLDCSLCSRESLRQWLRELQRVTVSPWESHLYPENKTDQLTSQCSGPWWFPGVHFDYCLLFPSLLSCILSLSLPADSVISSTASFPPGISTEMWTRGLCARSGMDMAMGHCSPGRAVGLCSFHSPSLKCGLLQHYSHPCRVMLGGGEWEPSLPSEGHVSSPRATPWFR